MARLDALPPDQRAVLALLVGQGRRPADIAVLLGLEPDDVLDRAHAALGALGPEEPGLTPLQRAAAGDVLLGEGDVADRAQVEETPEAQAWALAVAAELTPLDGGRLVQALRDAAQETVEVDALVEGPQAPPPVEPPVAEPARAAESPPVLTPPAASAEPARARRLRAAWPPATRRSRVATALAAAGLAVLLALALLLVLGEDETDNRLAGEVQGEGGSDGRVALRPLGPAPSAAGSAALLEQGGRRAVAVLASGLPAAPAYGVWLAEGGAPAFAGYARRAPDGALTHLGVLGTDVEPARFGQLLVTREPAPERGTRPARPGAAVLRGTL
jgi:hypothetical protein